MAYERNQEREEKRQKPTLARIIGAVVVAGNDVGVLRALAPVVLTTAQGELAVLAAEAGLDDVGGAADGGGLGRSDGEHGGERNESGLHLDGLGWWYYGLGLVRISWSKNSKEEKIKDDYFHNTDGGRE